MRVCILFTPLSVRTLGVAVGSNAHPHPLPCHSEMVTLWELGLISLIKQPELHTERRTQDRQDATGSARRWKREREVFLGILWNTLRPLL